MVLPDYTNYTKQPLLPIVVVFFSLAIVSCSSSRQLKHVEFHSLARAGIILGFDIEKHDDHVLYIEAASWVGVPYGYGGITRKGVDCSGLTYNIYKNVYGTKIARNCKEQFEGNNHKYKRLKSLQPGDLVFFSSSHLEKDITHVGIYLKNGRFIHASSSRGVTIDDLASDYWEKRWIASGCVKEK